jgi:hypothetical protein
MWKKSPRSYLEAIRALRQREGDLPAGSVFERRESLNDAVVGDPALLPQSESQNGAGKKASRFLSDSNGRKHLSNARGEQFRKPW